VDAFSKTKPYELDVILMDLMMPIMNGYDASKTIRGLNRPDAKEIPIIAMTANAFVEDKIAAKEAGMNEHLSKPLDSKLVMKTIANLAQEYKKRIV
jgi:two-component system, sensor histidine kinase